MMGMEKSKRIVALQLVELFVIVFAWAVQGSTGPVPPTTEGDVLSLPLQSPTVSPPLTSETIPRTTEGPLYNTASPPSAVPVHIPPLPSSTPERLASPNKSPVQVPIALAPVAPSSVDIPQNAPAILPSIPGSSPPISQQRSTSHHNAPLPEPITAVGSPPTGAGQIPEAVNPNRTRIAPSISPVQGVPPTSESRKSSPAISPVVPGDPPPPVQGRPPSSGIPENSPAISPVLPGESEPTLPVPGAPPPSQFPENSPSISPVVPGESPPITPVQGVPPTTGLPQISPASSPVVPGETPPAIPDGDVPPASTPPTSTERKRNRIPAAAPNETPEPIPTVNHSPPQGSFSAVPPSTHNATRHSTIAPSPSMPLPKSSPTHGYRSPASSPSTSTHEDRHPRDNVTSPAPASYPASPPSKHQDQVIPPAVAPTSRPTHYAPPPSPSAIPPTGRPSHYAPPPFPPAVPRKSMPRPYAPPPIPPAVPPTGRPTHYAPPPFPPAVPRKGMSRLYAPPPFPPAIPPTGRPTHYASPPFLPALPPRGTPGQHAPPPLIPGSSVTRSRFPFPPSMSRVSPSPLPALKPVSASTTMSLNPRPPQLSPSGSSSKSPLMPPPPPIMALPPPPPNEDCSGTICTEPLTNSPPGSPCSCVWPMQVGLSLGVDLYTFFPLVSELATEIAAGVFMKQSQVRIMGANAASQQPEKTVVLIDLVPLGQIFDRTTAYLTFQRFWLKEVDINKSYFGDYEVLYVRYQGLPPSPPLPPSSIGLIDDGQYSGNDNNGRTIKPLGVDVGMKKHKNGLSGSIIAIIVLSALVVVVMCSAAAWVLLLKHRNHASRQPPTPQASLPSLAKQSGAAGSMIGSVPSSDSLSFESGVATYTGSAKTYSVTDIERATNNFDESRILGEGGFGLVYSAVLDDGTKAAVKVLKRDDQQGGREFFAEVEMLSRLHHRNLVKLIGICTEERARCLVYELIPNGSVESHLHGVDKESGPLDWVARMKIALGAARGLAYLHEDSSPRVIHRDFKSSNILLENDFTPKVSDFGLARTALDEEGRHISTRVMGTFGYVAPEYAMTGHLLVKSDVYSYGVVLLELLTGRKPVDMSQPPGQENLVAWARPLLTSQQGLEILIDSSLGPVHSDTIAKVAAIASMCVQPEVSHRPFMGEVVQALKLVCSECDEAKETGSRSSSSSHEEDLSAGESPEPLSRYQYSTPTHDSGFFDPEMGASGSSSFRRHSSSGPLKPTTTGRGWQFLSSGGSVSEHRPMFRSHPGSY